MATKENLYLRGMELFGDDDLEGAIRALHQAVSIDPQYGDALHALAMCHYHNKDYANAVEIGEKFREVEPENPLAYTSLSMFYNARGMIAKAEEMGAKAGAQAPPPGTPSDSLD